MCRATMLRIAPAMRVAATIRSEARWARTAPSVSEVTWRSCGSLRQVRSIVPAPMIRAAKGSAIRKRSRPMCGRAGNQSTRWRAGAKPVHQMACGLRRLVGSGLNVAKEERSHKEGSGKDEENFERGDEAFE